jgi:hypothetical protein
MNIIEWRKKFEIAIKTPPKPESVLKAKNGKAAITLSFEEGKNPFLFARASINDIVGEEPEWFLRNDDKTTGLKVILMSHSRDEALRRYGALSDVIYVESLKVIRSAPDGRSLLAEVENW